MRWIAVLLLLGGCAGEPAPEPSAAADAEGAEREQGPVEPDPEPGPVAEPPAEPEPAAEPEPPAPMGRCHESCCSAEVLELQRRTAAETGDPSIEHECCFCDD